MTPSVTVRPDEIRNRIMPNESPSSSSDRDATTICSKPYPPELNLSILPYNGATRNAWR